MAEMTRYQLSPELTSALREYCVRGSDQSLEAYAIRNASYGEAEDQAAMLLALQMLSRSSPEALALLGDCYDEGTGLTASPEAAMVCWRAAADGGSLYALNSLGWNAYKQEDYDRAREIYETLLSQKDRMDRRLAGYAHRNLSRVLRKQAQPDLDRAIRLLTAAAEEYQDLTAQVDLGDLYADPSFPYASAEQAIRWYTMASAAIPDSDAFYAATKAADFYVYGDADLDFEPDLNKAVAFLEPLSKYDDEYILNNLATAYLCLDEGKRNERTENRLKAIALLERALAIHPDDVQIESLLGFAYYRADYSLIASPEGKRGRSLLEDACEKGYYLHASALGKQYLEGLLRDRNDRPDYRKAAEYYKCASQAVRLKGEDMVDYLTALLKAGDDQETYRVAQELDALADGDTQRFRFTMARLTLEGRVAGSMKDQEAEAFMLDYLKNSDGYSYSDRLKGYGSYHELGSDISVNLALNALGCYYRRNGDFRNAEHVWRNAFDNGFADAGVRLGELYETGGGTIAPNASFALDWYTKAAEAGSERGRAEAACFERQTVPDGFFGTKQAVVRVRKAGEPVPAAPSKPTASTSPPVDRKPTPKPAAAPQKTQAPKPTAPQKSTPQTNPQKKILYCRFCGAKLIADTPFCHKCGKKLK